MLNESIEEFIRREEYNLRASVQHLSNEVRLLNQLDTIYSAPFHRLVIPPREFDWILAGLYTFCYYHFYFSVITLLRCHVSEAFFSTRKAIEACLVAGKLLNDPDSLKKYITPALDREQEFLYVKRWTKRQVKERKIRSIEIQRLVKFYELCNSVGSHVEFNTVIAYRANIDRRGDFDIKAQYSFFQLPDLHNSKKNMFTTVYIYFQIFKVLRQFLDQHLKIYEQNWEKQIIQLDEQLRSEYESNYKSDLEE